MKTTMTRWMQRKRATRLRSELNEARAAEKRADEQGNVTEAARQLAIQAQCVQRLFKLGCGTQHLARRRYRIHLRMGDDPLEILEMLLQAYQDYPKDPKIGRAISSEVRLVDPHAARHLLVKHDQLVGIAWLWERIGLASLDQGQLDLAEEVARVIVELDPTGEMTAKYLRKVLGRLQDPYQREDLIHHSLDFGVSEESVRGYLGRALIQILRLCIQQTTTDYPDGDAPISVTSRPDFIRHPYDSLRSWRGTRSYNLLQEFTPNRPSRSGVKRKKIAFVYRTNDHFLTPIIRRFDENEWETESVRLDDIATLPDNYDIAEDAVLMARRGDRASRMSQFSLDADLIFVEWADYAAVFMTILASHSSPIIVRLHSNEIFTVWPHLVSWKSVDILLTVSDSVQDFANELLGDQLANTKQLTIPNLIDLERHKVDGKEERDHTLGMVVYNSENKNPLMAMKILHRLREETKHPWRLILIGHEWDLTRETEYSTAMNQYVTDNKLARAIEYRPFSDALENELGNIKYILSCSDREGSPVSIAQAMASGCIPIVRNWPVFADYGGAKNYISDRWIYETIGDAVHKILKIESSGHPGFYSDLAQREVLERFAFNETVNEYIAVATETV